MKTYILRDRKAVEPQNLRRRDPAVNTLIDAICNPAPRPHPRSSDCWTCIMTLSPYPKGV
jgi:hypothetical protein